MNEDIFSFKKGLMLLVVAICLAYVAFAILLAVAILDGDLRLEDYVSILFFPLPLFAILFGSLAFGLFLLANFLDSRRLEKGIAKDRARLEPEWERAREESP